MNINFFHKNKPLSLKQKVEINTGKVKPGYLKREFAQAKETLQYQNQGDSYKLVLRKSAILAVIGTVVGLLMRNLLLSPILGIGFALIPVWKVKLSRHKYDIFVANELESGLSVITTSYIRKNNLISAVEENIDNLNNPLKDVMQTFLTVCNSASPSITYAIKVIQPLISNDIWDEWCKELIKCQTNSSLRPNLVRIVRKLSDIKVVQSDIDVEMSKYVKEFISILLLALIGFPLVYLINPKWFSLYFTHPLGKFSLIYVALIIIVSLAKLISLMKPIRYRR